MGHGWFRNPYETAYHYRLIDDAIGKILPYLSDSYFFIVSDHGMEDIDVCIERGWTDGKGFPEQQGGHSPHGIMLSNYRYSKTVSGVYEVLLSALTEQRLAGYGYVPA